MIAPPQGISPADFEPILHAVRETERGRWFLEEFARRVRAEDTSRMLTAIERLEARMAEADVAESRARLEADRAAELLRDLSEMLRARRPLETAPPPEPSARLPAPVGDLEMRLSALARLDGLDVEEKLRLFG